MSKFTRWFKLSEKPVRSGEYEGRCAITGACIPGIHWRIIQDTSEPKFYVFRGTLGPFNCWEDVSHKINGWRGLTKDGLRSIKKMEAIDAAMSTQKGEKSE